MIKIEAAQNNSINMSAPALCIRQTFFADLEFFDVG